MLTELRPGVYVFGDAQQWELGTMAPDSIALVCRSTVVSHAGGRLVLDAGSKALGADRAPYATGWGRLLDHPDARIVLLAEHHAVVDLGDDAAAAARVDGRRGAEPRVQRGQPRTTTCTSRTAASCAPWPVAARGQNS